MSLFQRAATFAAMTLGIASLIGVSSPGFAFQLDRTVNVPAADPVPSVQASATESDPTFPAADAAPAKISPAVIQSDEQSFSSLTAAVAGQDDTPEMTPDLVCLAGAIYFEAKGEPLAGQLAVAEVIINRAKSGRFAPSICAVVTQRGQFSFVRGGRIPAIGGNANYRTAVAIAQVAMGDDWDSPAPRALYFHARRAAPGWRMQKVASIGNHVFYR
jgi:N-acetylmuramoyl-L-alanine amidase